ncbi:protein-tyrosine phosphatase-like protein [Aspergillus granulosus]|uniref:phosphatidylinositol-3,4,5-trisphosphate 3-phosphatase n=1 Tax=Aspergillus granulosus TaxID=176169 RepID=A0ABR4I002_9EURO
MASILRQIVAGSRLPHPEAGLDLCYVTDNIIATSGPSTNYPQIAYRTSVKDLVSFLDAKHAENWRIWEFRAEGTGYPDSDVYGRIHHFPFPDHHPPPFALIPKVTASMRNWLHRLDGVGSEELKERGEEKQKADGKEAEQGRRVVVVHCKAGKGRSGTIACSYLISQEGWKMEDALQRYTERRMRVGFGPGVKVPSQLRWVRYVDRWTNEMGKKYVERPVEILEIHIWGLRDGVKVAVEGFVNDGQKIKQFHMFHRNEHIIMSQANSGNEASDIINKQNKFKTTPMTTAPSSLPSPQEPLSAQSESSLGANSLSANSAVTTSPTTPDDSSQNPTTTPPKSAPSEPPQKHTTAVLLRPHAPLILPTSDINIDFERRSKAASYTSLSMVTSVAHVWFNPYFEGGDKYDSGVFDVEWDAMDGRIKGTTQKGMKALDRLKVLWRYAEPENGDVRDVDNTTRLVSSGVVTEPKPGEEIPETRVADRRLKTEDVERAADDSRGEGGLTS